MRIRGRANVAVLALGLFALSGAGASAQSREGSSSAVAGASLAAAPELLADEVVWRHDRPLSDDGSPLFAIEIAGDGAIWLAHGGGVLRYDGLDWRPVLLDEDGSTVRAQSLSAASGERIVAVSRPAAHIGDATGFRRLDVAIPGHRVEFVGGLMGPAGGIWLDAILTAGDGTTRRAILAHENGRTRIVELPAALPAVGIGNLWRTRAGGVWLNTVDGLYHAVEDSWELVLSSGSGSPFEIRGLRENESGAGAAYVHTPLAARGLWRWSPAGSPVRDATAPAGIVRGLDVHPSGAVLLVHDSQEVVWVDERPLSLDVPLGIGTAHAIVFADETRLWTLTRRFVSSFDPDRRLWHRWPEPRVGGAARINEILRRDDDSIWLGTSDGIRVRRADGTWRAFTEVDGRRLGVVTGLAEGPADNIWVGSGSTFSGLYRWDGRTWAHLDAAEGVGAGHFHRIVRDDEGRLWFLGLRRSGPNARRDDGLGVWLLGDDGLPRPWEHNDELPSRQVYGFDRDGVDLWFATMTGLARVRDGVVTTWEAEALRSNRIVDVAVDENGRTWFTDGRDGLGTVDADDTIRYVDSASGLPFGGVRRILVADGGLWLAGRSGVARFRNGVFSSVATGEVEPQSEAWPLLRLEDRLLAGSQGLGVVELDLSATALGVPVVRIESAVADTAHGSFRWQARSPQMRIPDHLIETRYRLDGGPWSAWARRNEVQVEGLSAGTHRLEVQGKGSLGEVSGIAAGQEFLVPQPLLRNPWFYAPLYTLSACLLALGIYFWNRRERQREELRRSEGRYRALFESASDVIVTRDLEGRLTSINRAGLALTGYTAEEVPGLSVDELMTPESVRAAERMLLAKLHGEDDRVFEGEIIAKDSSRIPVEFSSQLIHEDGKVVGAQAFIRDIRVRKRAEETLRNIAMGVSADTGDDFFRALVESLARELRMDYAFVAVPEGDNRLGAAPVAQSCRFRTMVLWGEGRFLENLGYDLAGTPCDEVVARGVCAYADNVQALFPDDTLLVELGVDSYVGTPLFDSAGQRLGIMVVMGRSPLRDEKLARSMLQIFAIRAAAEIEKMRAQDALRRTEEELRQAQKMEAIGRLAGGIAHDFNNLLTVVNGYTELAIGSTEPDDPVREDLEQIAVAGQSATRLTTQLLAFSRRQAIETAEVDPTGVTRAMAPLLERLLGPDDELGLDVADIEGVVHIGSGQLEQVLMNLVSNAVDATPEGGRIAVRVYERSAAGNGSGPQRLGILEVEDDGVGMDEPTRRRVFEPFFTTKAPGVGTGLGLSTVYGIVRQSGGDLSIETTPGAGTLVRIAWKLHDARSFGAAALEDDDALAQGAGTILLVEDQDMVRSFVERALARLGYRVVPTSCGKEALEYLDGADHVDLLLSDVVMPGMDGLELAERVRERRPTTQVLLMSGYTDRKIPSGLGAPPLLQKPFTPSELGERVRDLMEARPA